MHPLGRNKRSSTAPSSSDERVSESPETEEPLADLMSLKIRRRVMASKMRTSPDLMAEIEARAPTAHHAGPSDAQSDSLEESVVQRIEPAHLELSAAMAASPEEAAPPGARDCAGDMIAYWSLLRGKRPLPAKNEIDPQHIARRWPHSILLRRRTGSQSLEPVRAYEGEPEAAASIDAARAHNGVSLSPLMLQWLVELAHEIMREARPMTDEESFPGATTSVRYRAVGLPFSDNGATVDHVLCYVAAAE